MSNDLRSQMHRVADAVEPLPVDGDLWQRGIAARRRGQVLVVAAVVAIIASVAWSAVLLQSPDREARTASSEVVEGAIPSRITDVPSDVEPSEDYVVGRASVAFVSAFGHPVVVSATDGVPHVLDLPSFGPDSSALVLSPDGRRLAYDMDVDGPEQIEVVDLETGKYVVLSVHDEPLQMASIAWSPGSDRLAWVASRVVRTPSRAGTFRADGTEPVSSVLARSASSIAVADSGDAVVGQTNGSLDLLPLGGDGEPVRLPVQVGVGAFSPDGTRLALSSGPRAASYTFDLRDEDLSVHPFPEGTLGRSVVRPLGWIDDRVQLLLVQSLDGASRELVVTTPEVDTTSTWRRRVGAVETTGIANSLSVAVDLVPDLDGTSSQELTHDFGNTAPDQGDISWIIGLGVAAAIALLMALRRLWRRLRGV